MAPDYEALERLALRQCGFVATDQASALGLTAGDMNCLLKSGTWISDSPGIFRLDSVRHTALDEFAKWCIWFAGRATVSHYSAAELHGLGHLQPRFLHFSMDAPISVPARQLALHRCRLAESDCERVGPIRITTPVRTVLDIAAGGISQELLDEVVSDGVAIGRLDARELYLSCENATIDVAVRVELALVANRSL